MSYFTCLCGGHPWVGFKESRDLHSASWCSVTSLLDSSNLSASFSLSNSLVLLVRKFGRISTVLVIPRAVTLQLSVAPVSVLELVSQADQLLKTDLPPLAGLASLLQRQLNHLDCVH